MNVEPALRKADVNHFHYKSIIKRVNTSPRGEKIGKMKIIIIK